MSELVVKIVIFSVLALFVAVCLFWNKPVSDCGKLSLKLCLINALGWLLILILSDRGHPPPFLFPGLLFWLINLPLLPATAVTLWVCRREREEKASYLVLASAYVVLNIVVLYILPLIWMVREASR